jgi:hypothetical protein
MAGLTVIQALFVTPNEDKFQASPLIKLDINGLVMTVLF